MTLINGKNCKMSIAGEEIKGMENGWGFSTGDFSDFDNIVFKGTAYNPDAKKNYVEVGKPIKIYFDGDKIHDGVVKSVSEINAYGGQTVYFESK